MKHIHTFESFLNEGRNTTKIKITGEPPKDMGTAIPFKILLQKMCLLRRAEKVGDVEVVNNTQLGRLRDNGVEFEIIKD